MVSLKTDTVPVVQWKHHIIIFRMQKLHITQRHTFMKSWNVSIVLNLKTILYGYENKEIVKNKQLHKFLSEYIEKTKRLLQLIM